MREEIGDWTVRCIRAEIGQADRCQIYQLLKDDQDQPLAGVTVVPVSGSGEFSAKMTFNGPVGVLLPAGVQVSIDGQDMGRVPFLVCTQGNCVAEIPLQNIDLDAFKAGNAADFTVIPAAQQNSRVTLTASLAGFTAGFGGLTQE